MCYFLCLTCITPLGIHIIWAFLYFISPDSIELATENSCLAASSYTNQPRTLIPSMFANLCMTYSCSWCFPFSGSASAVLLGRISEQQKSLVFCRIQFSIKFNIKKPVARQWNNTTSHSLSLSRQTVPLTVSDTQP